MAQYDCVIIGGGPAGFSAGLYACRAGLKTVLLEEMFAGGQIATTHLLENYPGFPQGVAGPDFGNLILEQAQRFGLEVRYESVQSAQLQGGSKKIVTDSSELTARTVILCMGAEPRKLGVEREDELRGSGVSYCATCDGAFFRGKEVAVVGGGDTACEDAVYLSRLAKKVYVIHRRDSFRAAAAVAQRVKDGDNIEILWDSQVTDIKGEKRVESLAVQQKHEGERDLPVEAVFVAVGTIPRSALVKDQVTLTEAGYIATDAKMQTSLEGVYAAGDVRDTVLRQVVTAAADGAIAATAASEYLMTHSG
ncbi:MAG: thioredoxin-disulfide reductase [Eubacteriales bacterium]|nr:thioredoxin-disulfide reductase [Eubacteriales bacterium]